jgi:hypothetical protein
MKTIRYVELLTAYAGIAIGLGFAGDWLIKITDNPWLCLAIFMGLCLTAIITALLVQVAFAKLVWTRDKGLSPVFKNHPEPEPAGHH